MKVVGIAGPAGSGKSAVARDLARLHGAVWLDLDQLAWSTYKRGTPTFNALVVRFGVGIVGRDGEIDRAALAERAFADEAAKRDLDRIVHPAVDEALARRIREERHAERELLVVEGALLAHSPDVDRTLFDLIVWLEAPLAVRAGRLALDKRSHHVSRNADIDPPAEIVRVSSDGPLDVVVARVWRAIREVQ